MKSKTAIALLFGLAIAGALLYFLSKNKVAKPSTKNDKPDVIQPSNSIIPYELKLVIPDLQKWATQKWEFLKYQIPTIVPRQETQKIAQQRAVDTSGIVVKPDFSRPKIIPRFPRTGIPETTWTGIERKTDVTPKKKVEMKFKPKIIPKSDATKKRSGKVFW